MILTASHSSLTNVSMMEPINGFFLHDWMADPKADILDNHHKMSVLCPCKNHFAIIVRAVYVILRWHTLYLVFLRDECHMRIERREHATADLSKLLSHMANRLRLNLQRFSFMWLNLMLFPCAQRVSNQWNWNDGKFSCPTGPKW
jgi:hypothetical protein